MLEIAKTFLKLGVIAFGGPVAHIAMMEDEIVTKKKWMTQEYFLDLIGITNLIPGPNSTEMTMHCGYTRGGVGGLFAAGISFILPAVLITLAFAYVYVEYKSVPAVEGFLYGIKPAVLVIIAGAMWKLSKKALKDKYLYVIGLLIIVLALTGLSEIYAILIAGVFGILWYFFQTKNQTNLPVLSPLLLLGFGKMLTNFSNTHLFLIFLKVGAVLFGSGYVLVAYLDGELIDGLGWLTQEELLEAIAIGQFTPGPVLSTATFIGYQIAGWKGAVLATLGIFLPSFLYVWLINPFIDRLRKSPIARSFLDAVNVGALAVMLVVTFTLAKSTLIDWKSWLIMGVTALIYFSGKKVNVIYIIIGAAVMGYLLTFF